MRRAHPHLAPHDVPELPRHPLSVLLAVEHAGHALRRADRLRLRRSVRPARPGRRPDLLGSRTYGAAATITRLREELNAGGSKFCGDCSLKLPLKKDEAPPVRPVDAGALPSQMYIECTAACNISCNQAVCAPETGITRTRQAGMLDFELFRARHRRSRPLAAADRLLQLRRGVPAQARRRDVRVHQDPLSAHLRLYEHQRACAHRGAGPAAGPLRHRRGDLLHRRGHAGQLRQSTGSAAASRSPSAPCARWPTRSAARAARRRS